MAPQIIHLIRMIPLVSDTIWEPRNNNKQNAV